VKLIIKRLCLFFSFFIGLEVDCQDFSASRLLSMLDYDKQGLEKELRKKSFFVSNSYSNSDTLFKEYQHKTAFGKRGRKGLIDSTQRKFIKEELNGTYTYTYETTSQLTYNLILNDLKKEGFYCEYENDGNLVYPYYLYQHDDYTAKFSKKYDGEDRWYVISLYKKVLPVNKEIIFAEDLLEFTSHEFLVYYFGERNVKKDIYYFANNEVVNCSVLFSNTKRQVIFIWKDGLNRCGLENILVGGIHKLKNLQKDDNFVGENDWYLKNGVHPGMTAFELRALNGKNFSFSGGNSPNPGVILATEGNINFKNSDVVLGCMNCDDDRFSNVETIDADAAMMDGKIIFVLTIVLYPAITSVFY